MSLNYLYFLGIGLATILFACSSGDDGDSEDSGCSNRGATECGLNTCQTGNYCETGYQCTNGCTSDNNCACNQVCKKPSGENVGACVNTTASSDCTTFCSKAQACYPDMTNEQCSQYCLGSNEACKECLYAMNCSDIDNGFCDFACGATSTATGTGVNTGTGVDTFTCSAFCTKFVTECGSTSLSLADCETNCPTYSSNCLACAEHATCQMLTGDKTCDFSCGFIGG